MYSLILLGLFFGILIFSFTLIVSKKSGTFYLAPLVTFVVAFLVIAYSLLIIRGFEGMAYGFLGACFFIVALVGVLCLPFITRKMKREHLNKVDKLLLFIIPVIFFTTIGFMGYTDKGYWIIDEGGIMERYQTSDSYYNVTTISEGAKQVHIQLGNKYVGKGIEIKKVKTLGNTEIIVDVTDGPDSDLKPYITIGLDEIVEPFKVQTTDGEAIESIRKNQ